MEELKKENGLLLKLISSKTRQNQLLFQQYEQLAADNKAQAAHITMLKNQNKELRRASLTPKDQPRYTYAVLNSPRTQKLVADLDQTQLQLAAANQQNQKLAKEVQQLKVQINQLSTCRKGRSEEETFMEKSSEKIESLQQCLMKKEKEMKQLTLIMYAKDATTSEITLKQEQKNKEIDQLVKEISALKQEKDQKYAYFKNREEKAIQQARSKQAKIQQLQESIRHLKVEQNKIKQLEQNLKIKQNEVVDLQSAIASKSENLEELSLFMNQQAQQLQAALQKLENMQRQHQAALNTKGMLNELQILLQKRKQHLKKLQQQIQLAEQVLHESHQNNNYAVELIRQSQNQINSYQQIRDNLLSEIQHYNKQIHLLKQDLQNCQKQNQISESLLNNNRMSIDSYQLQLQQLQQKQYCLKQELKCLQDRIDKQKLVLDQMIAQNKQLEIALGNDRQVNGLKQLERQIAEKEESIATFMDVLDNLQNQVKAKDLQVDLLTAERDGLVKDRQSNNCLLETTRLERQRLSIQNKRLKQENARLSGDNQSVQISLNNIIAENLSLKGQIEDLESQIFKLKQEIAISRKERQRRTEGGWKQRSTESLQKQQYIEMLNAVIQSIKNQHQQSITKIQSKNHIISQLQSRLKEAQQTYSAEINNLRNSIACQEVISYQQLAAKFPKRSSPPSKDISLQQFNELLSQVEALREDLKQKEKQIQQLKEQERQQAKLIEKMMSPSVESLQDNNSRPISNIRPSVGSTHHFEFHCDDSPSQIELQNQSLHDTIEEQHCIILELQDNLMRVEHKHNSQVMALRKSIAELSAQNLQLKRTLYEINPKSLDLTAFVKEYPKKDILPSFGSTSRMRPSSPPTTTTTGHSQILTPNIPTSKKVSPRPSLQSNPYIAMMTNEKGELRFPESGSWSIQELRSLLQQ